MCYTAPFVIGAERKLPGPSVAFFDIGKCTEFLDGLTELAIAAAAAIQRARGTSDVRTKADGSPVTRADDAAEAIIRKGLDRLAPELPIISEEHFETGQSSVGSASYCLVDPLDGTREFIAGCDEYTVNIAVVTDGAPILGIIAAPALGLIWRGVVERGADRLEFSGRSPSAPQIIRTRLHSHDELVVMTSRSHLDARTEAYVARLPGARSLKCGSSIKFCRLAEGAADLYPRLAPTRDWDVAAGHAILAAAGGSVVDPDGAALIYGTPALRIPAFIAWGGPAPTDGAVND